MTQLQESHPSELPGLGDPRVARAHSRWDGAEGVAPPDRAGALTGPDIAIPPAVAARLLPRTTGTPLFPKLRRFGRGRPGVTKEVRECWIVRDAAGEVAGGALVRDVLPGHPPVVDVVTDPSRRREGWASKLYRGLEAAGIDMEAASRASLAHGFMTPDGYAFMLGRRARTDPEAAAHIAAASADCPGCGHVDLPRRHP